jgi:hypothetical protein
MHAENLVGFHIINLNYVYRCKCKHGGPQQATTMMQSCQDPSIKKWRLLNGTHIEKTCIEIIKDYFHMSGKLPPKEIRSSYIKQKADPKQ